MFKDLIIADNVLSDPDSVVEFAKKQSYYTEDEWPYEVKQSFMGKRTIEISRLDKNINLDVIKSFNRSLIKDSINMKLTSCHTNSCGNLYFEFLNKEVIDNNKDHWNHHEESVFVGFLFLNKHPEKNSGIIIEDLDGKRFTVENKYNRLVLYRGDYLQLTEGSFGDNVDNSRLTCVMFFDQMFFNVMSSRYNQDKKRNLSDNPTEKIIH